MTLVRLAAVLGALALPVSLACAEATVGVAVFPYSWGGRLKIDAAPMNILVELAYPGFGTSYGGHLVCGERPQVVIRDRILEVTVPVVPQAQPVQSCERAQQIWNIGTLAAGAWELHVRSVASGATPVLEYVDTFDVVARGTVCNVDPVSRTVYLDFVDDDPHPFLDRLANDPAWRASVGDPVPAPLPQFGGGATADAGIAIDPLADPYLVVDRLARSGYVKGLFYPTRSCSFPECPGPTMTVATEFRRAGRDRYIFVTDPVERDALDDGTIAGWTRTGETMRVIAQYDPQPRDGYFHQVYRFWGGSVAGEPSHFFTGSQAECAVLRDRREWNWTFERSGFWAYEWKDGSCPHGAPLYRTYNNGLDGAPAHRFSTKRSVIDEMLARGWVDEGPVMCVDFP